MQPTLLFLLFALPLTGCASSQPVTVAQVDRPSSDARVHLGSFPLRRDIPAVVDGDTLRVDGLKPSLRLIGVDAEEVFKDDQGDLRAQASSDFPAYAQRSNTGTADRPSKYPTPMGEAARDFARAWFDGVEAVRLEYDDPGRRLGYFGRHLVHVLAEKEGRLINYNVELVRQGYSPYFTKYGRSLRYHEAFLLAEMEARTAGRGIWAQIPSAPCYPDYPARLRWWNVRDEELQHAYRLRQRMKDFFLLGDDGDFEALKAAQGRKVTVVGAMSDFRETDRLDILYLGHRQGSDFAIVGEKGALTKHPLRVPDGDLQAVTGTVSLHRGQPQFRIESVEAHVPVRSVPVPN